jgi:hypothetical protein
MLLNQLGVCCDIPLFKGSVAGLPLICTEGGAPGYKSTGRSRIHDSIIIINSINSNLMSKCSACLILTGIFTVLAELPFIELTLVLCFAINKFSYMRLHQSLEDSEYLARKLYVSFMNFMTSVSVLSSVRKCCCSMSL